MAVISYTAIDRGQLIAGHSAETTYQIEIPFTRWNPNTRDQKVTRRSLSGKPFNVLHHTLETYDFATLGTENASEIAELKECFSSISAGELFSIDLYGTITTPSNVEAFRILGSVNPSREDQTYIAFSGRVERV
jgi:hypothetical protein